MSTKNDFSFAICVGLLILVAAGLEVAYAIKPLIPDPSEGWIYAGDVKGDWNWGISANITAHWTWVIGHPGHYIFDEWQCSGHRWGGPGVWYTGYLTVWWSDQQNGYQGYTDGAHYWAPYYYVETHWINCTAQSDFQNWIFETWTERATVRISI